MNPAELIRQAVACFQCQQISQGTELVKQAAALGEPSAVLYYADLLFKTDKQACYDYLSMQWERGVTGVLHRKALLKFFFDMPDESAELGVIAQDLFLEAQQGHVQSLLALLSIVRSPENLQYLAQIFAKYAPDLTDVLLPDLVVVKSEIVPSLASLQADFIEGVKLQTQFNTVDLSAEIDLRLARNALSAIECRYLILRFTPMLKPSLIVDPASGQARQNPYRTGAMVAINPEFLDWICLGVERKMAVYADFPRTHGEVTNLIHYQIGQSYLPHYDAFIGEQVQLQLKNGGQRVKTVLCYLNDVVEGGETEFPHLAIEIQPQQGDMLLFRNTDDNGALLKNSYHSGQPVRHGEKWLLSKWTRQNITDYGKVVYC